MKKIKLVGISGSLRKNSYNQGLIRAALETLPDLVTLEILSLENIPLYNQDDEKNFPRAVLDLKDKIKNADGILISTPEYNYSFPGVLKNAIDWCSRPYGDNSWDNKRVAIMGASLGMQGTSRAQYHLRQVFVNLNMHPLNRPELMISLAQEKFDEQGNLTDSKTKQKVKELVLALVNACS
ncbi:MAG: NAD(P)H-dependent oxidoreductase [Chlamydiae bacterium]|nr:NAD(P)H-dependent oxidoreductase [Chlamydiota bacterium]